MFRCAVKRTFQTSSFSCGIHVFKRGISKVLRGHIVGQIPVLKPRYVPGITGPKGQDVQMTGALKCSLPPVCRNVCLSELPPVCDLLNRKFHISQISNRVKNWYLLENVKFAYGQWIILVV